LSACRATEGIHVSLFFVVPKVIFDQHLHADLSFGHSGIISESGLIEAKEKTLGYSVFLAPLRLSVFACKYLSKETYLRKKNHQWYET